MTDTLFDPAQTPEVTAESLTSKTVSAKSIDAQRDMATALLGDAQRYNDAGNPESAGRLFAESKRMFDAVAASMVLNDTIGDYQKGLHISSNDVPVVDGEEFNDDDNKRQYSTSHKPAGWIKAFPAAVQTRWIREQMGDNEKAANEFYKQEFTKWFSNKSPNAEQYFRTASDEALRAMQEGTDNEGGYLVPEDFRDEVIHNVGTPGSVIRPKCRVIQTGRDSGDIPTFGTTTWAGVAEEAAGAESTPTIGTVAFTIWKSGGLTKVSTELLEDEATNTPALLAQTFNEARGVYEDTQIIGGDGTTEPEGLRVASVADVLMASATAVVAADAHKLYWTLPSHFRKNATMYTSGSFMQQLASIGSTAAGQTFGEDLTKAPGDSFLGAPTAQFDGTGWDNAAAIAANEEVGALGDFSNYYIIDRVGISVRRNDSLYMGNDQVGFFARARGDGRVGLVDAFRVFKAAAS